MPFQLRPAHGTNEAGHDFKSSKSSVQIYFHRVVHPKDKTATSPASTIPGEIDTKTKDKNNTR